jgi:hypothetical protein
MLYFKFQKALLQPAKNLTSSPKNLITDSQKKPSFNPHKTLQPPKKLVIDVNKPFSDSPKNNHPAPQNTLF